MMARHRHLAKAPITEAVVDFRATLPSGFDIASFESFADLLSDEYPEVEKRNLLEGGIKIAGRQVSQVTSDKGLHGVIFHSGDKKQIAQFRKDGFTFNKLSPYTSWGNVFGEAWNLWELYVKHSAPEIVSRIAVRYINHITIPLPAGFADHLTDPPTIPDDSPKTISNYFKKVVVHDEKTKLSANIVQALESSGKDTMEVAFLLDIDAYLQCELKRDDPGLREIFEKLRTLKNQIFFGSITEKTAEMYE
jgi:uncharacterized protein (TIGR04255 family)